MQACLIVIEAVTRTPVMFGQALRMASEEVIISVVRFAVGLLLSS